MNYKSVFCVVFILLNMFSVAFSDDTHVSIGIGGVAYFAKTTDSQISLKNENISIHLLDNEIDLDAEFEFSNDGDKVNYQIGFPVHSNSDNKIDNSLIYDFETYVNGQNVEFQKKTDSAEKDIDYWFIKDVTFKTQSITKISVKYKSKYMKFGIVDDYYDIFSYFYGSAYYWKGEIETFSINIINNSNKFIEKFENALGYKLPEITAQGKNTTIVKFTNIKPDKDSGFILYIHNNKYIGLLNNNDVMANTKNLKIDLGQIIFYNSEQLRLLRNLFYALNGQLFTSSDLTGFYKDNFDAYRFKPLYPNIDNKLNPIEMSSINVIRKLEEKRNKQ
jgi:YARHG domain